MLRACHGNARRHEVKCGKRVEGLCPAALGSRRPRQAGAVAAEAACALGCLRSREREPRLGFPRKTDEYVLFSALLAEDNTKST